MNPTLELLKRSRLNRCGPTKSFPFLGLDINAQWFHEGGETGPLLDLSSRVKAMRLSSIRINLFWDWPPTHVDAAISWAKSTGVPEILFDVIPSPPNRGPKPWYQPWKEGGSEVEHAWRDYAKYLIMKVPFAMWMIGNEPNRIAPLEGGSPSMWANIYRIFYEVAHEEGATVVGPALGHSTREVSNRDWLRDFFNAGARVDILGVHPYDKAFSTMLMIRKLYADLNMGTGPRVWAVETSGSNKAWWINKAPKEHVAILQRWGYERCFYHVAGGWREDRRAKGIDEFILFNRGVTGQMVATPNSNKLAALGRWMHT